MLGCDYFGAYRKYMRKFGELIQFCLAHLIRDVKFLTTLPDKDGKWLGGAYSHGVKGTADWTRAEGVARVPEDAASFSVQCASL